MQYPSVKISPAPLHENRFRSGGKFWLIPNLIEQAKCLPVMEIPLCAIFTGSEVWEPIQSPQQLARHMKQVMDADMSYPIIMDDEGFIMDGWHRVAKALLEGRETIKAVRFENTPAPDYVKE